jgi:hypothetical protein
VAGTPSSWARDELLDVLLGTPTVASTLHFGFWLVGSGISSVSDGSTPGEVTAAEYSRPSKPNDSTLWRPAASGLKTNTIPIVFPDAVASWGSIQYVLALDANTEGQMVTYWEFPPSQIQPGPVLIPVGQLITFWEEPS